MVANNCWIDDVCSLVIKGRLIKATPRNGNDTLKISNGTFICLINLGAKK